MDLDETFGPFTRKSRQISLDDYSRTCVRAALNTMIQIRTGEVDVDQKVVGDFSVETFHS